MNLRKSCLPPGWYPRDKSSITDFLRPYEGGISGGISNSGTKFTSKTANFGPNTELNAPGLSLPAFAAIAPHAGWYYSGPAAAQAVSSLDRNAETIVVVGGHLPSGMPVLESPEDGVITPLGTMEIDREFRDEFLKKVRTRPDSYADNTVEVLLPMVHYFFPRGKVVLLRFPADLSSFEAGKILAEIASELGRKAVFLASTDLTHYGENYGFSPRGRGKKALEWVKNTNDAAFIAAILDGDPHMVLKRSEEDSSACSAGSVLGALGFAAFGLHSGTQYQSRLLDYYTSADVHMPNNIEGEVPDSFVGYAAVAMSQVS